MEITQAEARAVKQLVDEQLAKSARISKHATVAELLENTKQIPYYKMLGRLSDRLSLEAINPDNDQ